MTYSLVRFAHLVGLTLMGAGLIGVWISDLRSRKVRDFALFAEAVRNIAVFYDGVVVPGAVILFVSGAWMIAEAWGGWGFIQHPWLAGMILLFVIEFGEGNTVTRLYFMRLRRLTNEALAQGALTRIIHERFYCNRPFAAGHPLLLRMQWVDVTNRHE